MSNKLICPKCKTELIDAYDAMPHWDACNVNCASCKHSLIALIDEPCAECRYYDKWEGRK